MKLVRVRSLLNVLGWVLRGALGGRWMRVCILVICYLTALAMQLGCFFGAVRYLGLIQSNHSVTFGTISYSPRDSISLLIFVSVALVLGFLISAVLARKARSLALRISVEFEERCLHQVLDALPSLPAIGHDALKRFNEKAAATALVGEDAVSAGRCIRTLLNALFPASMIIGCLAVLLWLNVWLTTGLSIIAVIALFFFFLVNRLGSSVSHQIGAERRVTSRLRQKLLTDPAHAPSVQEFQSSAQRLRAATSERVMLGENSRFIMQMLGAVVLPVIVFFEGISSIHGQADLANLVVFLLISRFALSSFTSLGTQLSALNSSVAGTRRVKTFLEGVVTLASPSVKDSPRTLRYRAQSGACRTHSLERSPVVILGDGAFAVPKIITVINSISGTPPVRWPTKDEGLWIENSSEGFERALLSGPHPYGSYVWINSKSKKEIEAIRTCAKDIVAVRASQGELVGGAISEMVAGVLSK